MAIGWYLVVSALIFCIGAAGVLTRRNPLVILLCLELMLNGANLALVAFARMWGGEDGQVFALIQAHLADELDLEPEAIAERTRFREDLEADSLDLYTLVQELEDTYGVHMSDEQAAQILTVGQAVDFVIAHDGTPNAS